jgi:hypothetical protein
MEEVLSVKNLKKYFVKKGFTGIDKEVTRVADDI